MASLGSLKGKTIKKITRVAGPPTSSSSCADGGQLLEWRMRGYHIALLFDANQICQGESRGSPPKPDLARTRLAPVQPKIVSKSSPSITLEKPSVNIQGQRTIVAPPDFKQSMTAVVRTDFRPPMTENPPKTSPVMTPNDFKQPLTSSLQSAPKELQIILCYSCGNNLRAEAKFCDSCGEAVTRQASVPSKENRTTPYDLHNIVHRIEPARNVTYRRRPPAVSCESCGREFPYWDKFCDKCGALVQLNYALTTQT
jgi:uncharacterized OB-fold protein